jgi:hemerythrin superfamily protein
VFDRVEGAVPMAEKNAIQLLAADHRAVEDLFEDFEGAKSSTAKAKIVQKICNELTVHAMIEEEIFYPAVSEAVEEDMLEEAYVEHDGAKRIIIELLTGEPSDAFYDAKVTVLKEMIEHHVYEEERQRDSMFAQVRNDDVDLDALGEAMIARKAELMAMAEAGTLPPPEMRTASG